MTQEQEQQLEEQLKRLQKGHQLRFLADGHEILVMITDEVGIHSGRPRYLVVCTTCEALLHEATTGVHERVDQHCRQHADIDGWKHRTV